LKIFHPTSARDHVKKPERSTYPGMVGLSGAPRLQFWSPMTLLYPAHWVRWEAIPSHQWSFQVGFLGECRFLGLQLFPLQMKGFRSYSATPILFWSTKAGRA